MAETMCWDTTIINYWLGLLAALCSRPSCAFSFCSLVLRRSLLQAGVESQQALCVLWEGSCALG